jgi:hypothetical protein
MRWEDERYVRLFTRDTPSWILGPWQARAVLPAVLRKLDRAGILELGDEGLEALAATIQFPIDVVEVGMAWWLKRSTFDLVDGRLVMGKFLEAQDAPASDAQRAREKRARDRDRARATVTSRDAHASPATNRDVTCTERDATVTPSHAESHGVTPSCAVPPVPNQPSPPEPPSGGGWGGVLPRSEVSLWGVDWIAKYEAGMARALGRPFAFERRHLNYLEQCIEKWCQDRTRIAEWVDKASFEFGRAQRGAEEPRYWSSYQAKGLFRWFNENRPGYTGPRTRSTTAFAQNEPTLPPMTPEDRAAAAKARAEFMAALKGGVVREVPDAE